MSSRSNTITSWARWLATFIGFPAAGVVARLVVGDVDSVGAAAIGGLAGGIVLGAVQALVGGVARGQRARWAVATAVGLGAGLAVGASVVGYRTDSSSLVVMGAVCGAGVGLAQVFAVPMRAVDRWLWISVTPLLWAIGWLITSQVIVDAEHQHAVFGSSGALFVSAGAGMLVASRRPVHAEASVITQAKVLSAGAS
jgi:hypothetical protein